jgi:hypothetical protein
VCNIQVQMMQVIHGKPTQVVVGRTSRKRKQMKKTCESLGFCCGLPEFFRLLGCYMQHRLVKHGHFGTIYRSHLRGSNVQEGSQEAKKWYFIGKSVGGEPMTKYHISYRLQLRQHCCENHKSRPPAPPPPPPREKNLI